MNSLPGPLKWHGFTCHLSKEHAGWAKRNERAALGSPRTPQFKLFTWGSCDRSQRNCTHPQRKQKKKKNLAQMGNRRAEQLQREENAEQNPCFWWAKTRTSHAQLCITVCQLSLREDSPRRDFTDCRCWEPAAVFPTASPFLFMGLVVIHLCAAKADLASQSKAVRRLFLKGCTVFAQTSKTKIEREF